MVLYKVQAAFSSHPTDEKQPALLLPHLPDSTISNATTINESKKEAQTLSRNTKNHIYSII